MPLLIRIDLIPGGDYREAHEIARGWITNITRDTRGNWVPTEGDYQVHLAAKGHLPMEGEATEVVRHRNVWDFLRQLLTKARLEDA